MSEQRDPISYRPDLPDWGVYLRWPQPGEEWIHPDDRQKARELLPGPRVFRRSRWDGTHYWLNYGERQLRVAPTMWVRVPSIDLEVGEQVELLCRHGRNDPGIYRIADIFFESESGEVQFYLQRDRMRLEKSFSRDDLNQLHEKHRLRVGFYHHQPPKASLPEDIDLLDVGDLLE